MRQAPFTRTVVIALMGFAAAIAGSARTAPIGADDSSRPLSERSLATLVAFTRLLGYVRHFDPADSAASTNWDEFARAGVDSIEGAHDPDELASLLQRLFEPLDPAIRLGTHP